MKLSNQNLIILLVIALSALLLVVLFVTSQNSTPLQQQALPEENHLNLDQPEVLAYQNNKFTLKYPRSFFVETTESDSVILYPEDPEQSVQNFLAKENITFSYKIQQPKPAFNKDSCMNYGEAISKDTGVASLYDNSHDLSLLQMVRIADQDACMVQLEGMIGESDMVQRQYAISSDNVIYLITITVNKDSENFRELLNIADSVQFHV